MSENEKLRPAKAQLAARPYFGTLEPTFWVLKAPNLNQIDQHNTNLQPRPTYNPKKDGLNKNQENKKTKQKKHPVQPQNQDQDRNIDDLSVQPTPKL